jgi:AcrR family transcriptional regulator
MKQETPVNSDTRSRILEAAGEVFAEVGFRCATVRMICERAGVNGAAINYHFRSKEDLYYEVLKYWHEFAINKYPPLLGADENVPPEEQLRVFILSLLYRILDKGKPAWFGRLMGREMAEPTRAFDHMVKEVMRPLNKLLASIVRGIVGPDVSEEVIRLCCTSIIGQCVYYYNAKYITELFRQDMSSPEKIERIADHIMRFSLEGLEHYSAAASPEGRNKASQGARGRREMKTNPN